MKVIPETLYLMSTFVFCFVFQFEDVDVGSIRNIIIGHDNSGPGAGWYLQDVSKGF
jgi:hypothetical protein